MTREESMTKKSTAKWIIIVSVGVGVIAVIGIIALITAFLFSSEKEENRDISKYNQYIGESAKDHFKDKWDMDETIFPEKITDDMNVLDYYMQYYNPWDAQYLSYLAVEYDDVHYKEEIKRLTSRKSTDYIGYYGATGFDEKYSLAAMNADPYQGFVYALTDNQNTIVYVELIFCNYFMDIDYSKYIKQEYLPLGFDATSDNPYEQKMMGEK